MTAIRFWRLALLAAVVSACGGSSTKSGTDHDVTAGSSGSGSTASGGSGSTASGGAPAAPPWLAEVSLDDAFPWFVQAAGGPYEMAPANAADGVVHVTVAGSPVEATVSTHNHFDVVHSARAIRFRAKANSPLTLLVSVKESLDGDYFKARDTGKPWPVAPVNLSLDWTSFTLPFADMAPPEGEVSEGGGTGSFTIAFIVDGDVGPIELWLDDVHFE